LVAINGKQAMEVLKEEAVQLIVSDVMMPEIDGFELCKLIKSNPAYSHIPVLLLTAKDSVEARVDGLEMGADAYMDKPFSPAHLKAQIASLLANRKFMADHFAASPLTYIPIGTRSKADEVFLEKLTSFIHKKISDPSLSVDDLATEMSMSRPTLYRKIKILANMTPNDLINMARLKRAAEILLEEQYKIADVAHMVGYMSVTQFNRNFFKEFKIHPKDYIRSRKNI
jgi:two-component system, cell cycle response regulator